MSASGQSWRISDATVAAPISMVSAVPPRVQEPMGEHVAALGVGAKLDLVDREKLDLAVERHRLDRADEIARPERDDLFFAGDQRDFPRAPRA